MNPFSHLKVAVLSDIGKKRKNNEDAFGTFPETGVFCVADGMGGGDDGEIASAAVVRAVEEVAVSLKPDETGGFAAQDVGNALSRGLTKASAWICHRAHERRLNGCGSTFVGAVFDPTDPAQALAVHAGDSRLYLLHGRSIKQVTRDHSVAELMGEKDESKVNPLFRSMVVNGIGIRSKVDPEFTPFKVVSGDRVLLCSDGLSRMVPDKRILALSRAEETPNGAVKALIGAALEAGGVDNVTAVLVEVGKLPLPVERKAAPPVPEPSAEAETSDEMTTGGGTTDSTGGTLTCATLLPEAAGESPFGVESPVGAADSDSAEGEMPVGEDDSVGETTAGELRPSGTVPKRRLWLLAAVVVVAAAIAGALLAPRRGSETPSAGVSLPVRPQPPPVTNAVSGAKAQKTPETAIPAPVKIVTLTNAVSEGVKPPPILPPSSQPVPLAPLVFDPVVPGFAAVCEEKPAQAFVRALRRLGAKGALQLDFDAEADRFLKSARQLVRSQGAREAEAVAVDLRVLLLNAEPVRTALIARRTEPGVAAVLSLWNEIQSGDPSQAAVQRACMRLMQALPEVRAR